MCYNVSIAAVNKAGEGKVEIRSVYTMEKGNNYFITERILLWIPNLTSCVIIFLKCHPAFPIWKRGTSHPVQSQWRGPNLSNPTV